VEKVYGKQKVYQVDQSLFPECPQEELREREKRITELQGQLKRDTTDCQGMAARTYATCICSM
jgi:hypothetical protein